MATIVNARDVLLQGASDRLLDVDLPGNIKIPTSNIPALTGVSLTATSQLFQIPDTGAPYPAAITLRAIVRNLTADPVLSIVDGTMAVTPVFDTDFEFTFSVTDMTSDTVTFLATVNEPDPLGGPDIVYTDRYTVLKTRESEGAVIGFLTNENFTLTADADGDVISYVGAGGHFIVIQGLTDITNMCTFAVHDNPQGLTVSIDPGGTDAGEYAVTGGFDPSDNTATVTFRATYGTLTLDKVLSLSKAIRGDIGGDGPAGDKTGQASLYAWSTAQPANPNGSSTYTWATGAHTAFTGPTWSTTVPSNPGGPGIKLWTARQELTATGPTTSTTVTWNSSGVGYSVFAQGENGAAGLQQATPTVYQWAASIPSGPSGSDTYTWAMRTYSGPAGIGTTWKFTPGTSPSVGFTLWAAVVSIGDSANNTTTNFNWTSAALSAVGYAGTNGSNGSPGSPGADGQQGASARTAYSRIAGNPTPISGNIPTFGPSSLPTSTQSNTAWGLNVSWTDNDPNPSSTNTLYQTDGFYNPATGYTVWNTPYISSLKVGTLSAITTNTGALNVSGNIAVGSGGSITGPGFSLTSSAATFSGTLSAPSGTLGQLSISGTGYINGNSAGFESGAGFYLNAQSFSIGQSGAYLSYSTSTGALKVGNITMSGLMYTPGKTNYDSGNGIMIGHQSGQSYLGVTSTASGSLKGMWVSTADGVVNMTGAVMNSSSSGTRISINESSSNDIRFYDSGTLAVRVGTDPTYNSYIRAGTGSSGAIGGYFLSNATALAAVSSSSYGITGQSNGGFAGVRGQSNGGNGVEGVASAGDGVQGYSSSGIGVYGQSSTGVAVFASGSLRATGAFGVNGNTPQGKYSVNGACSDLSTAIALINQLRAALIANGICV